MRRPDKQNGMTLIEVMIAIAILAVACAGIAQLVPLSISMNSHNQRDTTELVIAQREMDAMIDQPIANATFTDPNGLVCPAASVCNLGNVATPLALVGSPTILFNNTPLIDYTQAPVAGYNFQYADPDDPSGTFYDIRWAVITFANGANPTGRRIIVGVRRVGGNAPLFPITLDSMGEK